MISENVSQIYRMAQQSFNSNKNNTNLSILFIVPSICYAPLCQCLQSTASLSLSVCFSYVFLHNQRGKKKQKLWFIFNPIIPLSDCSICVSALYRHIWYARLLFLQMIFVYATFLGAHGGGGGIRIPDEGDAMRGEACSCYSSPMCWNIHSFIHIGTNCTHLLLLVCSNIILLFTILSIIFNTNISNSEYRNRNFEIRNFKEREREGGEGS